MIIDMLSNQERLLLLNNFNDTVTAYPTEKTISELFQEQVGKTPDHIALQVEVAKLTYRELNEQANQIAVKLQSMGTDSDEIVAV
ncbi:iturin family lipopeptide synthetase C/tyrocidine synthetase-2, partial [Paenibacillus sp. OK060]|uniref:AMP-binding protein n=1 Tax=Paenibacillus sp. OK060 TaxID=1881034 RepID=UPI000886FD1D